MAMVIAGLAAGCATKKQAAGAAASTEDQETQLRALVQKQAAEANQDEKSGQTRLVRRYPYYLKEYSVYKTPLENFDVVMRPQESRTRPFRADVKLEKTRYSTRLHRKANEARADNAFFRDAGQETLTYELRSSKWQLAGSLFVSEKTEEYVNGEWVPRRAEVRRTFSEDEDTEGWWLWRKVKGWLGR
jgi:hypothetical protein